jgi:hypothetical protein
MILPMNIGKIMLTAKRIQKGQDQPALVERICHPTALECVFVKRILHERAVMIDTLRQNPLVLLFST